MGFVFSIKVWGGQASERNYLKRLCRKHRLSWEKVFPVPEIIEDLNHYAPDFLHNQLNFYLNNSYDEVKDSICKKKCWELGEEIDNVNSLYGSHLKSDWIRLNHDLEDIFYVQKIDNIKNGFIAYFCVNESCFPSGSILVLKLADGLKNNFSNINFRIVMVPLDKKDGKPFKLTYKMATQKIRSSLSVGKKLINETVEFNA